MHWAVSVDCYTSIRLIPSTWRLSGLVQLRSFNWMGLQNTLTRLIPRRYGKDFLDQTLFHLYDQSMFNPFRMYSSAYYILRNSITLFISVRIQLFYPLGTILVWHPFFNFAYITLFSATVNRKRLKITINKFQYLSFELSLYI